MNFPKYGLPPGHKDLTQIYSINSGGDALAGQHARVCARLAANAGLMRWHAPILYFQKEILKNKRKVLYQCTIQ